MNPPITLEELEAMVARSGLNYSQFANELGWNPAGFRRDRAALKRGEDAFTPNRAAAIRLRFGTAAASLIAIARDALASLDELERLYGSASDPKFATPWRTARAVLDRARREGLIPPVVASGGCSGIRGV